MLDLGAPELLIVFVIILLLFGPGRIARTMGELGKGIRAFKDSISSDEEVEAVSDTNVNPKA